MADKGKRNNFRGDIWFEKKVDERVRHALREQEIAFANAHRQDTDLQLLEYFQRWARILGHTPNMGEIIGGRLIERRFGTWENVIKASNLPWPRKMPPLAERLIYKREYKKQAELFAKERATSKAVSAELRQQKSEAVQREQEERLARDMAWGEAHACESDQQLLDYLRQCAFDLERSPVMKDVVGGNYIAKRFGTWPLALTLAGIPLPKGMIPPKQKQLDAYRNKKNAAEKHNES